MQLITVFTPTYNRAYIIEKLYKSLQQQTKKNFEWIIVDDNSSDNTENLIDTFIRDDNDFSIKYIKQKHGGKHRAINKALKVAEGKYFFIVDSDDQLTNNAIELINQWVVEVDSDDQICGVSGERIYPTGEYIGSKAKVSRGDYVDATFLDKSKINLSGDKAEVYKTEVLKKFPFPEFEGEYFVTESLVWDAIGAAGYKIRWYNEPIYIREYLEDGLTKTGANEIQGHIDNYQGFLAYIKQCRQVHSKYDYVLNFSDYERTAKFLKLSWRQRASELDMDIVTYISYKVMIRPLVLFIRKVRRLVR